MTEQPIWEDVDEALESLWINAQRLAREAIEADEADGDDDESDYAYERNKAAYIAIARRAINAERDLLAARIAELERSKDL